jgi:hypothetical protein
MSAGMWVQIGPLLKRLITAALTPPEIELLLRRHSGPLPADLEDKIKAAFNGKGRRDGAGAGAGVDENGNENMNSDSDGNASNADSGNGNGNGEEDPGGGGPGEGGVLRGNDPSDLGPASEGNLVRLVEHVLALVGTKKAVYSTCRIDPNHFSIWTRRRKQAPRPSAYKDGNGGWSTDVGPVLKAFFERHFSPAEVAELIRTPKPGAALRTKVLKQFNAYPESSGGSEGDMDEDASPSSPGGGGGGGGGVYPQRNGPYDLGPADESKLVLLVQRLAVITGAKRRVYDTVPVNANHFNAWMKFRLRHPKPSRRDGSVSWLPSVAPALIQFMESHFSIEEVGAVLACHYTTSTLDPGLRRKIQKVFKARVVTGMDGMDGGGGSDGGSGSGGGVSGGSDGEGSGGAAPLANEDEDEDENEGTNDNEGDTSGFGPGNESRLVRLVRALVLVTGTKKSVYETCRLNANYFNQWLTRREMDPRPRR